MPDLSDKQWAKRATQLQFEQLDRVRAMAANWRSALLGLTSLFAAVAVIKGRENISDLTRSGRLLVVSLVGAALVMLVTGALLASWAAYGDPGDEEHYVTGAFLREWEKKEARVARRALRWAQVVLVMGVVAIAVATGVTWINRPSGPPAMIVLDIGKDEPTCGELLRIEQAGVTVKTTGDEAEVTIPSASIRGVKLARVC